jgi:hypothetical protein
VFKVVLSFLALFAGRKRKGIGPGDAASATEATATGTEASAAATDDVPVAAAAADTRAGAAAAATNAPEAVVTAATGTGRTDLPQGRKVMSSGFDMQAEIAKLAERIIEPVAVKFTGQDLEHVVGQIRDAFEQLNAKRTGAEPSFEDIAVNILTPVQSRLTDAERRRAVDRLSGAMAAFCQVPGPRTA